MKSMVTTTMISKRSATEVERHVVLQDQELGQQTHEGDVDRTGQRQAHQNLVDVAGGLVTGTDARNERTALLQVVCRFTAVEHQRRIEEAEEDDRSSIQHHVDRLTRDQGRGDVLQPAHATRLR